MEIKLIFGGYNPRKMMFLGNKIPKKGLFWGFEKVINKNNFVEFLQKERNCFKKTTTVFVYESRYYKNVL